LGRCLRLLDSAAREGAYEPPPRYNISPTDPIGVITVGNDGAWTYQDMRWWLVLSWWKKPLKEVPATFNARAETVDDKPIFRGAFQSRRCLIPVSRFYEWTGPKEARQPWFISAANGKPMTLAGLYQRWRNPETGESIMGCSIVVMGANQFMGEIHDRMPVIIEATDREAWLAEPRRGRLTSLVNGRRWRQRGASTVDKIIGI
jgi:putative SOS response-associated peptidase YedK